VLNRLLDGAEILIPGDGQAVQQFVSTRQVGHAMVAALETFDSGGWRAFNVGSPAFTSLLGFVQVCADVAGVNPVVRFVAGGPTGGEGNVFNPANAVFPFPNVNYVLDLEASRAARIAPPPVPLSAMIREALDVLRARPERRSWSRTAAELGHLGNAA
jgi:nucleoside-diphosphate-sugar epimerase